MEEESTKISEKKVLSCQKCKDQRENERPKKKIDTSVTVQQKPDSMQLNQSEFNTMSPEWEEIAEDELLEADRKFALRCNAVSTEKTISPAQELLQIDEQRGDCEAFVADQANIELQPENEKPIKFSHSIRKSDGWLQTYDVSKDNVKVIEEQGQQRDVTSVEVSKTKTKIRPSPEETLNEELTQRQQMLVAAMANLFRQQNQITVQQEEIPHQENAHCSNESKEMQLYKREIVIPGELESNRVRKTLENITKGHLECIDGVLDKIQGPEGDETASFTETKANSKMAYKTTVLARVYDNEPERPQPSKGYVTLRRPKSDDATVRVQKSKEYISGLPLREDCAKVGPQKTKDYVSLIPREQDLIVHSTETKDNGTGFSEETGNGTTKLETTKDYVSFLPREEPTVSVRHSETKDYVTFQRPKSDTVATLAPFSKDYVAFNRHKSHDAEVNHQKAKDYVTVRPRELDDATTRLQKECDIFIPQSEEDYTFVPSSQLEDYVVMIPAKKKEKATNVTADRPTPEPPTHIFWPVRRFQKPSLDPETPKQVVVLAGSSKGAELVLEPEEHHEPVRIQQLHREGNTIPLISFAEDFENAAGINTPNIPRNRILRTLLPCLPTEIPGFVQRIREHPVLQRTFFMQTITFYFGFLWGIIMSAALYLLITFLLNGYHTGHSNVASSLHDFQANLSIPMNATRHNHQNQLLDSKINISVAGVHNSKLDLKVGAVNTPVVNLDFETTSLENNSSVFTTVTTLLVNDWKFPAILMDDLYTETTLSENDFNISSTSIADLDY